MPKISVHLEADSADEFLSLLGAFRDFHRSTMQVSPQYEETVDQKQEVNEPGEVITASGGPYELAEPGVKIEQPAAAEAPAAPAKERRGRPRKEKPAEAAPEPEAAVEPTVAEPVAEPEPVKAEPAPAKVKTMPHAKPENGAATRQDLLDVFSEYVQRYGASFGFSDISSLLQKNLGDGVRKASDVPEDKLQVAIGAIKTAIADNPFNRKRDYA